MPRRGTSPQSPERLVHVYRASISTKFLQRLTYPAIGTAAAEHDPDHHTLLQVDVFPVRYDSPPAVFREALYRALRGESSVSSTPPPVSVPAPLEKPASSGLSNLNRGPVAPLMKRKRDLDSIIAGPGHGGSVEGDERRAKRVAVS